MPRTDDKKIWSAYAKGVKPLGKGRKTAPSSSGEEKNERQSAPKKLAAHTRKQPEQRAAKNAGPVIFDRRTERRLRQGEIEIDARLDLHGLRQNEAHQALNDFMARHAGRSRCLLIITGKGKGGDGVLRANLPGWLAALPFAAHILSLRPAAIKHGGGGAFYVLLRKPTKSFELT